MAPNRKLSSSSPQAAMTSPEATSNATSSLDRRDINV